MRKIRITALPPTQPAGPIQLSADHFVGLNKMISECIFRPYHFPAVGKMALTWHNAMTSSQDAVAEGLSAGIGFPLSEGMATLTEGITGLSEGVKGLSEGVNASTVRNQVVMTHKHNGGRSIHHGTSRMMEVQK